MINKNSLSVLGQFYFNIKESFESIYKNSNFYEKKISKTSNNRFELCPISLLFFSMIYPLCWEGCRVQLHPPR